MGEFFGLPTASKGNDERRMHNDKVKRITAVGSSSSSFLLHHPSFSSRDEQTSDTSTQPQTDFPDWQKRLATVEAKLNLLLNGLSNSTMPEASVQEPFQVYPLADEWGRRADMETCEHGDVTTEYVENLRESLSNLYTSLELADQPVVKSYHKPVETAIEQSTTTKFQSDVEDNTKTQEEEDTGNVEKNSARSRISFSPRRVLRQNATWYDESTASPRSKLSSSLSLKQQLKTPTEPLDHNQLAKRLRSPRNPWKPIKPSSISRARKQLTASQFIEWSRTLDPQKVGWCCGGDGMYYPEPSGQ